MSHGMSTPVQADLADVPSCGRLEKVYHARRIGKDGGTIQTHCIVAIDDEDAIYLAETVGGTQRVDLWDGARLVKAIEPL